MMFYVDGFKVLCLMAKQGLTRKELCEKADISGTTLTRFLESEQNVKPHLVGKLAAALNVEVTEILGGDC